MRQHNRSAKPLRGGSGSAAARALPLLLLAVSVVVASIGAASAHRLQRSHQQTAAALLRDYAAFAAWTFGDRASDRLSQILHYPLHPVAHPEPGEPPIDPDVLLAQAISRRTTNCDSVRCRPGFLFRMQADGTDFRTTQQRLPPDERMWLASAIGEHARRSRPREGEVILLHVDDRGVSRHIAYLVREHGPAGQFIYGYEFEPEQHEEVFEAILSQEALLPPTLMRNRSNTEALALRVVDPHGRPLFSSGDQIDGDLRAEQGMAPMFGGLAVEAWVRPEMADQLVIGGLPRSRVPWMLLVFGISAVLAGIAVLYLRRESQLARMRTDFVSSVSHELRTPLSQARLFLETLRLRRYDTDEEREWMMSCVERETGRLAHLVENILRFSNAERAGPPAEPDSVELGSEIVEIATEFRPLAEAAGNRIRVSLAPDLFAPVERDAFRQVLLNLLDNATKYGAPGQTVTIRAEHEGAAVLITIEDEGMGVDEREREAIWQPFRRGRSAIGTTAAGSGIGLAVVREIVDRHGGSASVEGAEGGGARFVLRFPVERRADRDRTRDRERPGKVEVAGAAAAGRKG